jgi:cytochrome bd-type quinol oxidase subunit 2
MPPKLIIWQTAAVPASQIFMLLGTLVLLPIILGYIGFVYWLFRGKVRGAALLAVGVLVLGIGLVRRRPQ